MDFSFSEEQIAIQDLAKQIFSDRYSDDFMLKFSRSDNTYDDECWQTLAEQGLLGICIDESLGGTGLGLIELCCVLEQQGKNVAPLPLYSSLVLGTLPIAEFGSTEQKEKWLKPLAAGEIKLSAAISSQGLAPASQKTVLEKDGLLTGVQTAVLDGAVADAIIVKAEDVKAVDGRAQSSLYIIDTKAKGVSVEAQQSFNGENLATLTLNNVEIDNVAASLLGKPGEAETMLAWLQQRADLALSAMLLGVCDEALRRTAEFTAQRKQFGAPLGSFQAVAMRAADAYIDCEAMRSTHWGALWRVSEGLPSEAEVRAAKYWACKGSHQVVHAAQHLHGGMGADVEFPIHRFFIMAKQLAFISGSAAVQLDQLGKLLASNDEAGLSSLQV